MADLVFILVLIMLIAGIIYGLYTRRGSGIDHHTYGNRYSSAPGANKVPNSLSHDESAFTRYTRGTR